MKFFRRRPAEQLSHVTIRSGLVVPDLSEPVEMTGTTTVSAQALATLYAAHGRAAGGILELQGRLVPEHDNPADSNAVAVQVADARIGYVPGFIAQGMPRDRALDCLVQLWAAPTPKGLRVRGWVIAGTGPVRWPHMASNPPPVTIDERRAEQAADTTRMVNQALGGGGERAEQFKKGMVGGLHYLETVEPIKQFKREGRLTEALALCYGAIEAAENSRDRREPAPWYTEQAAIIHRKLGERDKEEAVLRRWLAACPPERRDGSSIQQRLAKLVG
ncbi:hypothetical protein ACVW00_003555 [Marmoricola sp. URHA0025 HA25]